MTNREWLNSLSDEKLAYFLARYVDCEQCPIVNCDGADCQAMCVKWLRAEKCVRDENEVGECSIKITNA